MAKRTPKQAREDILKCENLILIEFDDPHDDEVRGGITIIGSLCTHAADVVAGLILKNQITIDFFNEVNDKVITELMKR